MTLELVKVAAVFPNFKGDSLTWEMYWKDLHFIPKDKLLNALTNLRQTGTFFPAVSEIIKTSIGQDFNKVKWNPFSPATIADIIHVYKKEYTVHLALQAAKKQNRLDGPKKDRDKKPGDNPREG